MKSFFETCFIAACLAFILWLIVSAGIKCQVTWMSKEIIKGDTVKTKHEYVFKIGGMNEEERTKSNMIAYWNNSENNLRFIVIDSLLSGYDIQTYLQALYPQYGGGNIEQHTNFYLVSLDDCTRLNSKKYDQVFSGKDFNTEYTIVFSFILTKSADRF